MLDRAEDVIDDVSHYLFVDFDNLTTNPGKVMLSLEQFLKRNLSSRNAAILKSLNLPRCSVSGANTRMDHREWLMFASDHRLRQADRLTVAFTSYSRAVQIYS